MKKFTLFFMLIFTPFLMFSSAGRYIRFEQIIPEFKRESVTTVSSILQDREDLPLLEERNMKRQLGKQYEQYSLKTPFLFPLWEN